MTLTFDEQIAELEELLKHFRYARATPECSEHRTYLVLKAAAEDLRSRQQARISETQVELQRALDDMLRSKSAIGYESGPMKHVASQLLGRWSTVQQALEHYDEKWRDMKSAPRDATEIVLRFPKKNYPGFFRVIAHWADGGGDEQPRFKGWFRDTGFGFAGIADELEPTGWRPI